MNIAFEYAKLCEDEEVKAIYETILNEWQVTKEVILAIEGYDELLAENPYLKASLITVCLTFNILNYIQLELIKRQRRGELSSDQEKLVHTTINGIATGLRVIQADSLSNFLFYRGSFESSKNAKKSLDK